MKKSVSFLLAVACALIFALSGCSDGGTFTERAYSIDVSGIQKITVQVTDRDLQICASQDDNIYIDYFDGEKEYLEISNDNATLSVNLAYDKNWTDFIGTKPAAKYRKILIRIPDNCIAVLSASTTNENISVSSLSVTEKIELEVNGGSVIFDTVSVGDSICLTAKNGDITGTVVGGWDDFSILCKIKKGDCNLPELKESGEKSLFAECNNGNINIDFVK